jgi:uncharacterized Ntn-hydrolase superfamily protein
MKTLLALLLLTLFALPLCAEEARTFTNTKGEKIQAGIISATDTHVELQIAGNKRFKVAQSTLSEDDRKYIAEWRKTHRHYKVQVLPVQKKSISREEKDFGGAVIKGNDCWYAVELKNTEAEQLTGVRLEYIVYAAADSGVKPLPGAAEVPPIAARKSSQTATGKLFVPQKKEEFRSGLSSVMRYSESGLAGVYLELFVDGKPAGSLKSGTVPDDAAAALKAWREQQTAPAAPPGEAPEKKMIEKNISAPAAPLVATFSIVARDPATGELGVAVQSRVLGVGAIVPFAKAGVGAIATQSYANVTYGPEGMALLTAGKSAQETLNALTAADKNKSTRQAAVLAPQGKPATFTGDACMAWAGGRAGEHYAVQGNILAGEAVVTGMAEAFEKTPGPLAARMLAALDAGQAAGGDKRGMQSAALLVVRDGWGYGAQNDRYMDLRVDDHATPITELRRLYELHTRLFPRPKK